MRACAAHARLLRGCMCPVAGGMGVGKTSTRRPARFLDAQPARSPSEWRAGPAARSAGGRPSSVAKRRRRSCRI